jgi:hypothetical protein
MKKAVLDLFSKTIPFIIQRVRLVITKLTGNLTFPAPTPTLLVLTGLVDDLETKYEAGLKGDRDRKAEARTARTALLAVIPTLLGYIQSVSGGDEEKILSSGVDVKKTKSPVGVLQAPANVRSRFGINPGEFIVNFGGVKGRLIYRVQLNPTPGDNTGWADYSYTGKNRAEFSGLVTGQEYSVRIAAVSAAGSGEWSDPIVQKAL